MCRLFSIKSKEKFSIQSFAIPFSKKCKESKEWQGDGWGISWLDQNNNWQIFKSLSPIWQETSNLEKIPQSKIFLIHARSSSFEKDKNQIEYNQPFIDKELAFLFNGNIVGVKSPTKIPGKIGSQKIFNLIKNFITKYQIKESIKKTKKIIESNSKKIEGLNISLCDKKNFYNLCRYGSDDEYYQLRYFKNKNKTIISSEDIADFNFKKMKNGQILTI